MIKVGIDIHGVIDSDPDLWAEFTRCIINSGNEVHIITGPPIEWVKPDLIKWGIDYTHLFSIIDYHESIGTRIEWKDSKNPWMEPVLWNPTKADYCRREGISIHIDDSPTYAQYFDTPYAEYFKGDGCK